MKYTLVWNQSAEDDLASFWLDAPSGQQTNIQEAVDIVEAALRHRPHEVGESRGDGTRLEIQSPVALSFEVHDDERTVRVLSIRLIA
jgi:hypothetical protein